MALVECRLCRGKGRDAIIGRHTIVGACPACGGRGHVQVAEPPVDCAHCKGCGLIAGFAEEEKTLCTQCEGCGWHRG